MGELPVLIEPVKAVQESVIYVSLPDTIDTVDIAWGIVWIVAPDVIGIEGVLDPMLFKAVTCTWTKVPNGKLYELPIKSDIGTMHEREDMTENEAPLQFVFVIQVPVEV